MRSSVILSILFFFASNATGFCQIEWSLKKDKDGIKVYTGKVADSKFKVVRVTAVMNGCLSSLASIILQPQVQPEWVIATKSAKTIKSLQENHLYYYAEASLPWPMSNRDMVIDLQITQEASSKKMTVRANTISNILAEKDGLQRVPYSHATWEIYSIGKDQIQIDYNIRIDPGGGIPPWMVNMFIARAPFESFRNLKRLIQEKRFQHQQFDFIKE
ncbi:MAG: hypothetical protein K2Q21_10605 [Chitinophagaceae bacterium]|nr:hypothetical protein [Chitinophagaceae bacterium]